MNIFEKLTRFVQRVFKTSLEIFLEALKLSPNAQGYVSGSITELLLKKKLEGEYGVEVKRIREKWEGKKHSNHHGDFYFRRPCIGHWYVMESKGVKSNSEDWHKLYNYNNLKGFLITHAKKIAWINPDEDIEPRISEWINTNLPKFQHEYAQNLYKYDEIKDYLKSPPKRETTKSNMMVTLKDFTRDQINQMIDERLEYVMSKVKILETHFVAGRSESSERTQATHRKDEFNAVSVDIFLRYPEHKFFFANPKHLESSGDDPNHLQQNYIMGFVFTDDNGNSTLSVTEEWYEDFNEVYETLNLDDCVKEEDMQIDNRYIMVNEDDE
ncbi:MAG: hypothetical protein KGZ49_09045 [Syntrophaceae bacterium]|nr:hypothetical protein [Syntrophaceae bacterium]